MNETIILCQRCGAAALPGGICHACMASDLAGEDADAYFASGGGGAGTAPAFTILSLLGRGGMGQVFRAHQSAPARDIAVKMLSPHLAASPDCRRRLLAEATAMSELDHPAILPVYAVGELDGIPYFTMRLVEGGTLSAAKLRLSGRWREMAALMATVADAVHHAHERGVLHRDLKPGNILFDAAGHPFVSDFGLAKLAFAENSAESLTHSAQLLGTPGYMAPEIAGGSMKSATTASDVYALGAILYELLSGHAPFEADSIQSLLRKIVEEEPAPLLSRNALIPRDLAAIAHKAMEKRPAARYATAAAFGGDLLSWLEGKTVTARPSRALGKTIRWARRRPAVAALSAVLLLGTLTGGALLWRSNLRLGEARTESEALVEFMTIDLGGKLRGLGRLDLLDETSDRVERYFAAQPPGASREEYLFKKARFHHWKSVMLASLGRYPDAAKAASLATGTLDELCRQAPSDAPLRTAFVEALAQRSLIAGATGGLELAKDCAARAAVEAAQAMHLHPARDDVRLAFVKAHSAAGDAAFRRADHTAAEVSFTTALNLVAHRWPDGNLPSDWLAARGTVHYGRHVAAAESKNWPQALESAQAWLNDSESLLALDPRNAEWKEQVTMAWELVGRGSDMLKDEAGADRAYREFYRLTGELTATDPLNTRWRFARAVACEDLAYWLAKDGRDPAGAVAPSAEFLRQMETLNAQPDPRSYWKRKLNEALAMLAGIKAEHGEHTEAAVLWQRCAESAFTRLAGQEADSDAADSVARTVKNAWSSLVETPTDGDGPGAAALQFVDGWLARVKDLPESLPQPLRQSAESQLFALRATACEKLSRHEEAAAACRKALATADSLRDNPAIPADSRLWRSRQQAADLLSGKSGAGQ